jgi:carboxylesterase
VAELTSAELTKTVLPGAEPFAAVPDGWADAARPRVGVLLCHGFTGSPQSLRAWAEHLLAAGFRVALPVLPGHGTHWTHMQVTRWPDWYAAVEQALRELRTECDTVFVGGLSMGGGLALRLAEKHGDEIAGLILVNPSVKRNRPVEALIPPLSLVVPSMPGIASDIKREGADEVGYDRVPLKAARSLTHLWRAVAADLAEVTAPVLLFRSETDHVVHASSSALVLRSVSSRDVEEVVLHESYHVATLDNDAERIFEGSVAFIRRLTAAAAAEAPSAREAS